MTSGSAMIESWLVIGLMVALAYSLAQLLVKSAMPDSDPLRFFIIHMIFMSGFSAVGIAIFYDDIRLPAAAWSLFAVTSILVVIEENLFIKSLKHATIAKTVPLLSLTPLITTLLAAILLNELPSMIKLAGIILIAVGTYALNYSHISSGFLHPIIELFRNKGSRYMFYVAMLYGIGSVVDKVMVKLTGFLSYILLWPIFALPVALCYYWFKKRTLRIKPNRTEIKYAFLYSTVVLVMGAMQMYALSLTYVAYITAIKRVSAVFSVAAAYFLFKEREDFYAHLTGAALMALGVYLLAM